MKRFEPQSPRLVAPCASILAEPNNGDQSPLLSPAWDKAHFEMARDYPIDMLLFVVFNGGY